VYGAVGNRFALEIMNDRVTFAMADTRSAVTSWVGQHLPSGTYTGQGSFYLHAIMNSEAFFPMQSGYRDHLRRHP
jgi:hypothetical protein